MPPIFNKTHLAKCYFQMKNGKHAIFKINLSNAVCSFGEMLVWGHKIFLLLEQSQLFWKLYFDPKRVLIYWHCEVWRDDKLLCSPTSTRNCFNLHVSHDMPRKCYLNKLMQQICLISYWLIEFWNSIKDWVLHIIFQWH